MKNEKLTIFLYKLVRDHVPLGVVETILRQMSRQPPNSIARFSNEHLEKYAASVASELSSPVTPTIHFPSQKKVPTLEELTRVMLGRTATEGAVKVLEIFGYPVDEKPYDQS